MPTLPGRLGTLVARDLMTEKLVVLHASDTVEYAADLFRDLAISGAPVVDSAGAPIGVLSVTDIVAVVAARMRVSPAGTQPQTLEDEWALVRQLLTGSGTSEAAGAREQVGTWMSRRLTSVREDAPLVDVARLMCRGHWHRVTVVDAAGKLRGIVSTMDVLAALVAAADEARS